MFWKIEKEERSARSAKRFFCVFSTSFVHWGSSAWGNSCLAERPVSSTCPSQVRQAHRCESHRDTAHQPEQPAPMERVLCGVFLGALLVVPAGPVRRSSGEQEQALGLEMVRQSLHPTCQSRCAQTETERERGRETDRDRETETETETEADRQAGRQVGGRGTAVRQIRG